MPIEKVNLSAKLALFSDHFSPKIVGELNDSHALVRRCGLVSAFGVGSLVCGTVVLRGWS